MQLTVLFNDKASGNYNPLMVTVEVRDPTDEIDVMDAVCETWASLGAEQVNRADIELLVAFKGNLIPVADWRE